MNNQRGSVFPLVIILASVFLLMVISAAEIYVSEKKFQQETREKLMLDHLIRLAAEELLTELENAEGAVMYDGIYFYPKGDVYYQVSKLNEEELLIVLFGSTIGNRKVEVKFRYSLPAQKMIEWIEK
ncbi:competence type IV pilus minor pilin ComGG [Bacillus sp. M6-12]|uniref:competence type IV pilus minor pilin ComGG n=1 Tax=Bacillus sp. M6-12 TaxID=2054166 RepID=UPI0015E09316|nr:competence type IV pilus minor pilin ComGG [Bacillus sp. M6-12]